MPWLFVLYNVSISKYFVTLHWVRYSYHNYIGKVTWWRIFWWFYQSPNSSPSHSLCFFRWAQPPFYNSDYYSCIIGMLGTNHSCTYHSFLVRWSPYSSDAIAHVKTNTFPSQMALRNTRILLPQVISSQVPPFERLAI
jgi:hypothetical protein